MQEILIFYNNDYYIIAITIVTNSITYITYI